MVFSNSNSNTRRLIERNKDDENITEIYLISEPYLNVKTPIVTLAKTITFVQL